MNTSTLCSVVVTLCVVLISSSPMTVNAKGGLAAKLCMDTLEDKDGCMELLKQADPKIVTAKSYEELARAVLGWAVTKGTEGQIFLKGLALVNNNPAIVQCAGFHYDGVVASFKSAMAELKDDPQTASYDAKVASDGPAACERGLVAAKINNPAIIALNRQIVLLSTLAFLAICEYSP
ncbi:unnamed protein product [Sphenostylis stenocarpa]|uniref:Pectinesterase inhibitor domain-containing protein n=1 Tax=Sphenostylis stenocarpa TaxID=92480 RepID=A0AA86W257_9FABA|nr:unnamed protein product [Sphenostylis stenocarpa]